MSWLIRDLHYGLRESIRRPGFTALAILTLAFGVGATTAMYSVIYNVLLNPFPYAEPRRMVDVVIEDTARTSGGIGGALTVPEFRAYVDESDVFEEAVGTESSVKQRRTEYGSEEIVVGAATPNLFHFLGVKPLLGRVSTEEDAKPGASPVAVMSYQAWMTRFGGDPAILGHTILVDGKALTIIGVMPPHFAWNTDDIWIPDRVDHNDPKPMDRGFWLQARLKPGISLPQAQAQLNVIAKRLAKLYPERYPKRFTIKVLTVIDWVVGKFRAVLYTLFGAVGLLLLIACCNVANMLLSRATAREREIAVRAALGATRFQIVRQLLVESSILSLCGGVLGLVLAYGGTNALVRLMPPYTIPVETVIEISIPVLLFALASAVATTFLFGVAPALHSIRKELAPGLSGSGKGEGDGTRHSSLRSLLVVAEVALSLILLVGAGALMRSFLSMTNLDLGFNSHNIVVVQLRISTATPAQRRQLVEAATARLAGMPGIVAVSAGTGVPPYSGIRTELDVTGKIHAEQWNGQFETCDSEFFRTVGIRFLSGRAFSRGEVADARKVAVVNQTLVSRYFGNGSPIGSRIRVKFLSAARDKISDPVFEIIGVVADIRNRGLEAPIEPEVFLPMTITSLRFPTILIRIASDAPGQIAAIRSAVGAVGGSLVAPEPAFLDDLLAQYSYSRPRFSAFLMSVFAGVGLLLIATGIYGVMAYTVSQQTREIGIRMALGAQPAQVFRAVLGVAIRLIGIGVVGGALGSVLANRLVARLVWTVAAFDPVVLSLGIATITILGVAASYVPALRATKVQPVAALRHE
jgi:putative ABC transport system permease protein